MIRHTHSFGDCIPVGFAYPHSMDDSFLASLRCPIDPKREATFMRDQQSLVCSGCQCRFPVKQGLPVLIPDEAELPEGIAVVGQLPCVSASRRHRRGN